MWLFYMFAFRKKSQKRRWNRITENGSHQKNQKRNRECGDQMEMCSMNGMFPHAHSSSWTYRCQWEFNVWVCVWVCVSSCDTQSEWVEMISSKLTEILLVNFPGKNGKDRVKNVNAGKVNQIWTTQWLAGCVCFFGVLFNQRKQYVLIKE